MNRSTREGLRELSAGEWDSIVGRQQIDDNEAADFILRAHFPVSRS
jgi:hypothetical protein